jgi:hypothetical protein
MEPQTINVNGTAVTFGDGWHVVASGDIRRAQRHAFAEIGAFLPKLWNERSEWIAGTAPRPDGGADVLSVGPRGEIRYIVTVTADGVKPCYTVVEEREAGGRTEAGAMKTADIQPGHEYWVRVPERESLIYGGCLLTARVVRAGFRYKVERVQGSQVRGAPFKRRHESAHANGVEVEWDEQRVTSNRRGVGAETVHPGRAIVNARAVQYPADSLGALAM